MTGIFKIRIRNSNSSNSCNAYFSSPKYTNFPWKRSALSLHWQDGRKYVVDNTQINLRILLCFAAPLLQSNRSLYSAKHKAMIRTGSKGWANQQTLPDGISSLLDPLLVHSLWDISRKFKKFSGRYIFKVQNCWLNLPKDQNQFYVIYTFRWKIKDIRLFTVLYFSVRSSRLSALCCGLPSCMSVKTT